MIIGFTGNSLDSQQIHRNFHPSTVRGTNPTWSRTATQPASRASFRPHVLQRSVHGKGRAARRKRRVFTGPRRPGAFKFAQPARRAQLEQRKRLTVFVLLLAPGFQASKFPDITPLFLDTSTPTLRVASSNKATSNVSCEHLLSGVFVELYFATPAAVVGSASGELLYCTWWTVCRDAVRGPELTLVLDFLSSRNAISLSLYLFPCFLDRYFLGPDRHCRDSRCELCCWYNRCVSRHRSCCLHGLE
jgi:hypothetical protein